jgi:hypothetical protein
MIIRYIFHIIIVILRQGWQSETYLVNGLTISAKTDIPTVLKYKFQIIIVKVGQAGKGLGMRDIPEWFDNLSQD